MELFTLIVILHGNAGRVGEEEDYQQNAQLAF
jgi:hypothetical protein